MPGEWRVPAEPHHEWRVPGPLTGVLAPHCATRGGEPLAVGTRPRQDSNLRTRLRRPVLYPLSYGGSGSGQIISAASSARHAYLRG